MKITDYEKVQTLNDQDLFLIDGETGTKTILASVMSHQLLNFLNTQEVRDKFNIRGLEYITEYHLDNLDQIEFCDSEGHSKRIAAVALYEALFMTWGRKGISMLYREREQTVPFFQDCLENRDHFVKLVIGDYVKIPRTESGKYNYHQIMDIGYFCRRGQRSGRPWDVSANEPEPKNCRHTFNHLVMMPNQSLRHIDFGRQWPSCSIPNTQSGGGYCYWTAHHDKMGYYDCDLRKDLMGVVHDYIFGQIWDRKFRIAHSVHTLRNITQKTDGNVESLTDWSGISVLEYITVPTYNGLNHWHQAKYRDGVQTVPDSSWDSAPFKGCVINHYMVNSDLSSIWCRDYLDKSRNIVISTDGKVSYRIIDPNYANRGQWDSCRPYYTIGEPING